MKGNPHKSKKIYLAVSEASLHVIAAGPPSFKAGKECGREEREQETWRGDSGRRKSGIVIRFISCWWLIS